LNAHTSTQEKSDNSKDSPYEEIEKVFVYFPKHHIQILLEINEKLGREDIFKPTIGNDSLHQDSNDNCVRIVKCVISKCQIVKRARLSATKHS
jgi:hypothetical protein